MTILLVPLVLLIHLLLLINTRFTLWPEMVVYPYLLNNGFQLYKDIINPYMPAFIYVLSIVEKIFGSKPLAFQIFTWAIVLSIDVVIFKIAKKLTGNANGAIVSTAFFVIFSIPFLINGLWFDLVQTPFIILSVFYFYKFIKDPKSKESLLYSSIFVTIAFFIKQQALWLIIWYLVFLIFKFKRESISILAGNLKNLVPALAILLLHIFFFSSQNLLGDFTYWTLYFPFFKASSLPGYILLPSTIQVLIVGALFAIFTPLLLSRKNDLKFFIITAIALVPFAYPRFDYFHLVPSFAVLSIVFVKNVEAAKKNKSTRTIMLVSILLLSAFTVRYFVKNLTNEVRFFESDIFESSRQLENISLTSDSIYIQNGPDQVFALANRLPAKPWADEFPWYLETNDVSGRVLTGIRGQNPKYVIFKPYEQGTQYKVGSYRPEQIANYIDSNYQNFLQISPTLWLKIKK